MDAQEGLEDARLTIEVHALGLDAPGPEELGPDVQFGLDDRLREVAVRGLVEERDAPPPCG